MRETIYRGYDFERDVSVELEYAPNAWTSYHLSIDGALRMSYDSLINATDGVVRAVAELGGDPQEALDAVIAHFHDDKIYAGEIEGDEMPWLINEYEWDDEEED
jgi:hypothetical protein